MKVTDEIWHSIVSMLFVSLKSSFLNFLLSLMSLWYPWNLIHPSWRGISAQFDCFLYWVWIHSSKHLTYLLHNEYILCSSQTPEIALPATSSQPQDLNPAKKNKTNYNTHDEREFEHTTKPSIFVCIYACFIAIRFFLWRNCLFFKMWPECWELPNKYGQKHAMLLICVFDQARGRDGWILAKSFFLPVCGWDKFGPDTGQIDLLCWGFYWSGLPCFTALQKVFSYEEVEFK